jgi:heme iron utilization protein
MSVDNSRPPPPAGGEAPGPAARRLLRTALKGALATLDGGGGDPYASLVLVATEPDGTPILLISRLARHTRNLQRDPRASLLLDGTGGLGDPLTGGRVTLVGRAQPSTNPTALRRFLARHPAAETYAAFPDFSVFALEVSGAHFIGGFGQIVDLGPAALSTSLDGASQLIEAEPGIIEHMNADHADALALYATEFAGCAAGEWRMTGIDPGGIDLLHCTMAARVDFAARVHTPGEARKALVALAERARAVRQERTS